MKKFVIFMICLFCLGLNFGYAYDEDDLILAINKTYNVNGKEFILPSSIRNKVINYVKANDITEEQSEMLMSVVKEAVNFANEVGTTEISKLSSEELKKGIEIVNKAANVLDMEIKVNSDLDTFVATEKETGKIVEEIEKKEVFFKNTGRQRNDALWCGVAFGGLVLIIICYVLAVKFVKKRNVDIVCNTVMLLYIVCGMPLICFGSYFEILDLLKPVLSSEVGEGYIDIKDVEIDDASDKNNLPIKYPALGEMYAKLNIPSCDIDLSVYYGDNEKILDVGVGHYSGSHFPGQGKGILYTTHNTSDKLYNLKDIKVGDSINIATNFGKFNYKVTKTEVIKNTDKNKANIEANKELLMIYTCYPFDASEYTDQRFMVYCERSEA